MSSCSAEARPRQTNCTNGSRKIREIRGCSFDNESADLSGIPTSRRMVKHPALTLISRKHKIYVIGDSGGRL